MRRKKVIDDIDIDEIILDKDVHFGNSIESMKSVYDFYNSFDKLVAREVTFTVNPAKFKDVQLVKRSIVHAISGRLKRSLGLVAAIIVRENHKNGYPHLHGIVWYLKEQDNSYTLCERIGYFGRTQVDELRKDPYEVNNVKWDSWFDYIMKDQGINWKVPNLIIKRDITIDLMCDIKKDFID